jgi:hypothetical protein
VSAENLTSAEAALIAALRGLRFGAVEATVHDGRIVRIERREKVRLDDDPKAGAPAETHINDFHERPKERSPGGGGIRGSA